MQHSFENHGNVVERMLKLRTDFVRTETPSTSSVRYLVKKVKETGILIGQQKRAKLKTVHRLRTENIPAVAESVCEAPATSIHRRS